MSNSKFIVSFLSFFLLATMLLSSNTDNKKNKSKEAIVVDPALIEVDHSDVVLPVIVDSTFYSQLSIFAYKESPIPNDIDAIIDYFNVDNDMLDVAQRDSAFQIIIDHLTSNNKYDLTAKAYLNWAIATKKTDLVRADQHCETAIEYYKKTQNIKGEINVLKELAVIHGDAKDFEKFKANLFKAEELAEINGYDDQLKSIYSMLITYFEENGHSSIALDYRTKHQEANIAKNNLNKTKIANLQEKICLLEEEKELQFVQLSRTNEEQKRKGLVFFSCLLLTLLAIFVAAFNSKIKDNKQLMAKNAIIEEQSKELNNAKEIKSRFFANISHELKVPLSLVIWPIQNLIDRAVNTNNTDDLPILMGIKENINKLKDMIHEILDLSRLEAGKMEVVETVTPLLPFLDKILESYGNLAQQENAKLSINCETQNFPPYIKIDQTKFEKIVGNLITNAIKFSNKSLIEVNLSAVNDHLMITVKDNGLGIPPDEIHHIFDRFYQINQNQNGNGLGLAVAYEMAQLMGGDINVESKQGQGSTFTFNMPLKNTTADELISNFTKVEDFNEAVIAPGIIPETIASKEESHILIVEDNTEMVQFIESILTDQYKVSVLSNGLEAIEKLKQDDSIDLILSDILMPELDGINLLQWTKTNKDIPFVLISALNDQEQKLKALQIGADEYLTKPFSPVELNLKVRNLIHYYKKQLPQNQTPVLEPEIPDNSVSFETQWLKEVENICMREIDNSNFVIAQLANELSMSERQVYRKINKITGLTPNTYLREIRLNKAKALLDSKSFQTVAEVAFAVGFETPAYFSRLFKKKFGKSPKLYL